MTLSLKHMVIGLIIFSGLVGLMTIIYGGFEEGYGIVKNDTQLYNFTTNNESRPETRTGDVMDALEGLNIRKSTERITTAISKLTNPTKGADLFWGLTGSAAGILTFIGSIITTPFEILGIITRFYHIPPPISATLGLIFLMYISFMMWQARFGRGEL